MIIKKINLIKIFVLFADINELINTINDGIDFIKKQDHIEAEAALLSRCLYRMKMKFRKDKSFKAMQKINKILLRYLNMDLLNSLVNFTDLLSQDSLISIYLPNCNLLDHILLQLQGLGKLMSCSVEICELAAHQMESKILIGHFWKVAFITFSLVSRIRLLCKNILTFTCDFYQKLLPYRANLKNHAISVVPDNYEFPKNLRSWLNIEEEF